MHRSRLGARPPRARPGVPGTARAARQSPAPRPPSPPPRSVSVDLNGRPCPRAGAGDLALRVRAQLLMLSRTQLVRSSRPFAACLCFAAAGASRPRVLIHQLGSTNNDKGDIDEEGRLRSALTLRLHRQICAAGGSCAILTSGGCSGRRNIGVETTATPHWQFVASHLLACGLPSFALVKPGLPALHTVDEALQCREFVLAQTEPLDELLVVTSDFHAQRAAHLFGLALIGTSVQEHMRMEVVSTVGLPAALRRAKCAHERKATTTLRTAPFGAWAAYLAQHGLEAANRDTECTVPVRHAKF
jgi:hypothetical protein